MYTSYSKLQVRHVFLLLCQIVNYMEVIRLPVYYPSEEEKEDPKLYANNVRKLMATEVWTNIAVLSFFSERHTLIVNISSDHCCCKHTVKIFNYDHIL